MFSPVVSLALLETVLAVLPGALAGYEVPLASEPSARPPAQTEGSKA